MNNVQAFKKSLFYNNNNKKKLCLNKFLDPERSCGHNKKQS